MYAIPSQVHFKRSVKRVAYTVCKGNSLAYNAFKAIRYHVLKAKSEGEIKTLFSVLGGSATIDEAMQHLTSSKCLQNYAPHHKCANWEPAAKWSEWWTRPRHLSRSIISIILNEKINDYHYYNIIIWTINSSLQICYQQVSGL